MKLFAPHATDFYKPGHARQYPPGTELVYSNMTPRSARHAATGVLPDFDGKLLWLGLQGAVAWLIEDLWSTTFFSQPRDSVLRRIKRRMDLSLGVNAVDVEGTFGKLHDLGYMPLEIRSLAEGQYVPMRVPLYTLHNTKPEFYWLTNYVESQLSANGWKTPTVATFASEARRLLIRYAEQTGTDVAFVDWQSHDFSMRGMSGIHDAASSGIGHLLNFRGTDNVLAIDYVEDYYLHTFKYSDTPGSVPASEHSVACMHGKVSEIDGFAHLLNLYPAGTVSIVSDTWDFWRVMTEYTVTLKDKIMARNGKTVFRPDSGDPVKIICGDPAAPAGSPAQRGAVECLWEIFGGTTTATGHRLLDEHVGLIYGDSITLPRMWAILEGLKKKGFASGNIVFGVGSYTYNLMTRDTFGIAMKATYGIVDGEGRELYKDPVTDDGTKKSARGLLRVERENGELVLYDQQTWEQQKQGELNLLYRNGWMVQDSWERIKKRMRL